jgi:SAM-dependent methyltransferase
MPDDSVILEDCPCPLGCPRSDRHVVSGEDRISGVPGRYDIVECTSCGLMRTNPRPTPGTMGAYYPDSYGPYHADPANLMHVTASKARLRNLLGFDSRRLPNIPTGTLFELGCASGEYLEGMRSRGWRVAGIEFSPFAAEEAREKGLDVQTGAVEDARNPEETPDIIVAWMVLEHLHEPLAVLERLRDWIAPTGYLVFSVPDASSVLRRTFGSAAYDLHLPNHLYHYTPATLARLLASAGWTLETIRWQRNPQTLLRSLGYVATDRGWTRLAGAIQAFATRPAFGKPRALIGLFLAWARQSGRIEVWARPTA